MTDETPDQTADPTPEPGPESVLTPTMAAFSDLAERVQHLESHAPALDDDDEQDGGDLALVHERLTRHRSEIEHLKRTVNALIRYLGGEAGLPAEVPPTPVATPAAPIPRSTT